MSGSDRLRFGAGMRACRLLLCLAVLAVSGVALAPGVSWGRVVSLVRLDGLDAGPTIAAGKVVFGWVGRDQTASVAFVPAGGGRRHRLWQMRVPRPTRTQEGLATFSQSLGALVASPGGVAFIRQVAETITPGCRLGPHPCGAPSQVILESPQLFIGTWHGHFVRREGCGYGRGPFDLAAVRGSLVVVDANPCGKRAVARVLSVSWDASKTHTLASSSRYRFTGVAGGPGRVAWLVERRNSSGTPIAVDVLNLRSGHRRRLAVPHPGSKGTLFFFHGGQGGLALGGQGQVALLLQRQSDTAICGEMLPRLLAAGPGATRLRPSAVKVAGTAVGLAARRVLVALGGPAPPNCPSSVAMALVSLASSKSRALVHIRPGFLSGQVAWDGREAAWYGELQRSKEPAIWTWRPGRN